MCDSDCDRSVYDYESDHSSDHECEHIRSAFHAEQMNERLHPIDPLGAAKDLSDSQADFNRELDEIAYLEETGFILPMPGFDNQPTQATSPEESSQVLETILPVPTQARARSDSTESEPELVQPVKLARSQSTVPVTRRKMPILRIASEDEIDLTHDSSDSEPDEVKASSSINRPDLPTYSSVIDWWPSDLPTLRPSSKDGDKSRNVCFTLFNEPGGASSSTGLDVPRLIQRLEDIEFTYCIVGREVCPETGRPHGQGYMHFKNERSFSSMRRMLPGCHLGFMYPGSNIEACITYCSKDEDIVFERGVRPMGPKEKGKANALRWQNALELSKAGKFDELPADIQFLHLPKAENLYRREQAKLIPERVLTQHLWYWGATGTGKSRKVHDEYNSVFLKPCNKWWPYYDGEEVVLIDDFDKIHNVMVYYLKIWADAYPFQAESKGGYQKIRPKLIIVTSNYHPRDIWTEPSDYEPILRRFKCVEFKKLAKRDTTSP